MAVLFSKYFMPLHYDAVEIVKGLCLKIVVNFEGVSIVFLNEFAPTVGPERVLLLNTINDILESLKPDNLLFFAGDFNCTENYALDRNHLEPHSASQKALVQVIEQHDLFNVWRNLHQNLRQYPWTHSRGNHYLEG